MTALGAQAQEISTESKSIDCGQVLFQSPVTAEFQLRNSGRSPLVISQVRTDCGCTTASYPTQPIPAGASFTVSATYDARTLGHFYKRLAIYSNDKNGRTDLVVKGKVVTEVVDFSGDYPFEIGPLSVDINNVEFDNVNRGDRPRQVIHVRNSGSETLQPVVMHLPPYLLADVSPSRVTPGHTATVTIMLDSEKLHDYGLTQTSVFLGAFPGDKVAPYKEIPVSTVLLPGFEDMTDEERADAPKIRFSSGAIDLPAFNGKSKSKGVMTITNEGNSVLEIRSLQLFTAGVQVQLGKRELKPGESTKLKVTANAKELKTVRSKPRVLMITNDPENTKVTININVE